MLRTLFALLAAAALAATGAQAAGVREAGDWVAVCDNLRSCTAFLLSDTKQHERKDESVAYVMLKRGGGANAPLELTVIANIDEGVDKGPWTLWIDGWRDAKFGELDLQYALTGGIDGDFGPSLWTSFLSRAQSDRLIAAFRHGRSLSLRTQDNRRIDFRLAGAEQALNWIDVEQLRSGADTALWREGRQAEALPPLPVTPKIVLAPKVDQYSRPAMPAALQDMVRSGPCHGKNISTFIEQRLAQGLMLWAPACEEERGIFAPDVYLGDEATGAYRAIALPVPPAEDAATFRAGLSSRLVDPRYVVQWPADHECGRGVYWAWTGSALVVTREWLLLDCRGVYYFHDVDIYVTDIVDPAKTH